MVSFEEKETENLRQKQEEREHIFLSRYASFADMSKGRDKEEQQ